jgi:hypothetical protein
MTIVRSVRVVSAAKVNGILYGVLGLLLAPFFILGPGLQMIGGGRPSSGIAEIIVFAAVLPFLYAIVGFISGAVFAFLYNAISHAIGGIEVELEPSTLVHQEALVAPPAPYIEPLPAPQPPQFE